MTRPLRCFISYSHKDDAYRLELEKHLKPLRRAGLLETWSDRAIDAGTEWVLQIHDSLDTAEIILLLVSADFLASDFCWEVELKKAMTRHDARSAKVIPVFVHPCHWQGAPFEKLQGVPDPKVPISEWDNRNRAFTFVAEAVHKAAEEMSVSLAAITPKPEPSPPRSVADSSPSLVVSPLLVADSALAHKPAVLAPGTVFQDFPEGPELVVIPPGEFLMGSPQTETGRFGDEGPQHPVMIGYPLAVGRYPVTFAEWDAALAAGGCNGYSPNDRRLGRGRRPVINVSWKDAQAYVAWLVQRTGKPYRLLSEAEWEYACRSGTTTARHWGDGIDSGHANYDDSGIGKTTEVGQYPANDFGLYDMLGNVWEWVEDVWRDRYVGAPVDGSAWTNGLGSKSDSHRVVRGGSWLKGSRFLRSAFRIENRPDYRGSSIGFRVARTL